MLYYKEDFESARRFAWHEAKRLVKVARDLNDIHLAKFFVKKAMWHRSHAKRLTKILKDNSVW